MNLFDVYPLLEVTPVKALGANLWDDKGQKYLDFYGGHAVISIGHSHPHYIKRITEQVQSLGFYSNSVQIPIQKELANKLGKISGYDDNSLFLCNSGAEAVENALKLASFHTGKDRVLAFEGSFHGRTSGAVAITDNKSIVAPFNANHKVDFVPYDLEKVEALFAKGDFCATIIEPIQGVGGIVMPGTEFLQGLRSLCDTYNVVLILDEIQSGYGRSGMFFAHQLSGIKADIITMAKGMGNGFPIGGILISPQFKPSHGLLGTTFGGSHLACAAALAVLEVMEEENLIQNAKNIGEFLKTQLANLYGIKEVRGAGLMIGLEFSYPISRMKTHLLSEHHIFVGTAKNPNVLRLLPPLGITQREAEQFVEAMQILAQQEKQAIL